MQTYTPAAINKYIKSKLDTDQYLQQFIINGEVSNVKYHSNENIYFRIKDETGQIDATMFSSYANKNTFELKEGQEIDALVNLTTIVKMGKYSLNVKKIKLSGEGRLYQLFQEMARQLKAEGLFDSAQKKAINPMPKRIGIITSPTGAAIQDMISTLKRRNPIVEIVIIPCLVQGERAAKDIASKIEVAQTMNFDTIIVGRGGGSIENLWAYNEEIVARAIYNSIVPIISSVGHETDTTIADYVADLRAPTPTAAAELIAVDIHHQQNIANQYVKTLSKTIDQKIKFEQNKLTNINNLAVFTDPLVEKKYLFDQVNNQLDIVKVALKSDIKNKKTALEVIDLEKKMHQKLISLQNKLNHQHELIDQLNPLAILSRGYSVIKDDKDKMVTTVKSVEKDDILKINLKDGILKTKVLQKEYDGKNI